MGVEYCKVCYVYVLVSIIFFLDYYKFWLKLIDSFSDINILVIVVGIYVEKMLR